MEISSSLGGAALRRSGNGRRKARAWWCGGPGGSRQRAGQAYGSHPRMIVRGNDAPKTRRTIARRVRAFFYPAPVGALNKRGFSPDNLDASSTHGVDLPRRPRSTPTTAAESVEGGAVWLAGRWRHGWRHRAHGWVWRVLPTHTAPATRRKSELYWLLTLPLPLRAEAARPASQAKRSLALFQPSSAPWFPGRQKPVRCRCCRSRGGRAG